MSPPTTAAVVEQGRRLPALHWVEVTGLLALRTFRLRYLRSKLGVGWAFVQPLLQTAVLAFVFTQVFSVRGVEHYPVYVVSGIMTWQAVSAAVGGATTAAVDNGSLLRKVAMPAAVFPVAHVGSVVLVYGLQVVLLVLIAAVVGTLDAGVLLLVPAVVLLAALAVGTGLLTCSLHVAFRDVKFVVDAGLLLLFYASPVLYDPASLPGDLRGLLMLNPGYGLLSLVRAAVLDRPLDGTAVLVSAVAAVVLLAVGLVSFQRRSRDFGDLV